ncbi:transglutaminase domain-containing protein [Paenibacillus jilunlii]|uniref:Transglutaminase n=1 Tax=Paenibacillus jilunlii TaxID=682956 RepID=A0A1G9VUS9_9BACL|nr:transglutaminase domain-containing protein [Paenibacillus jilunlii]KWX76115.1 transglutaminase [Paenibacillus jilunlii]SDM76052.1 Transglutaminase-like superfamily protein [Paenibacillus jilunlii]
MKKRYTLAKAMLGGMLVCAALPPALYWGWDQAYAASTSAVLQSGAEMAQKLTAAMNNRRENITFVYEGKTASLKSQVQKAIDQAMGSDPYLYYIIDSYAFSYRGSSRSAKVTVQVAYRETLQQTALVNKQVKTILQQIISPGMNQHQKVKVIHDWVVLHLKYDNTYRKYTAYEGLQSGSAVCQGYSLLTYKLLLGAGIPNKIVEGTAKPEGGVAQSHAWNLVQLDGRWYHLDTTWDDPTPSPEGGISTVYYMRTDAQMRRDHSWTKSYPAASVGYAQTLSELVSRGGQSVPVYQELQKKLDYRLYEEDEVITSAAELNTLVREAAASGKQSLLFRYRGSEKLLKIDLQGLYSLGLENLAYTSSPFDNTGDLRVYVTWK